MKLIQTLAVCLCLYTFLSSAQAEPLEAERSPIPLAARFFAVAELRLGATTAPYFTGNFPEVRGRGIVGLLSAGYRISDQHRVAAEIPLLAISVQQPWGCRLRAALSEALIRSARAKTELR